MPTNPSRVGKSTADLLDSFKGKSRVSMERRVVKTFLSTLKKTKVIDQSSLRGVYTLEDLNDTTVLPFVLAVEDIVVDPLDLLMKKEPGDVEAIVDGHMMLGEDMVVVFRTPKKGKYLVINNLSWWDPCPWKMYFKGSGITAQLCMLSTILDFLEEKY